VSRKPRGFIPKSFLPHHYEDMKNYGFRDSEVVQYLDITTQTLTPWKRSNQLGGARIPREHCVERAIPSSFTVENYMSLKHQRYSDTHIVENILYVSPRVLHVWKTKNNLIRAIPKVSRRADRKGVIRAYESGAAQIYIAERFGLHINTVHRIVKKHREEANDHISV
jgi:hypothetical protein